MRVLALTVGILAGVAWAAWSGVEAWIAATLVAGGLGAVFAAPGPRVRWLALFLLGLSIGALRVAFLPAHELQLPQYVTTPTVSFTGAVADEPERLVRGYRFRLRVEELEGHLLLPQEDVLVLAEPPLEAVAGRDAPHIRYGDVLRLHGALQTPATSSGTGYRAYLARQDIHVVSYYPRLEMVGEGAGEPWRAALYTVRARLAAGLERALPEPQAALAQALLLGRTTTLPPDLREAFNRTGAAHILAVSGLNIGIVLVLLTGASAFLFGRRRQVYLLLPLAGIWTYALLAGFEPPVQRAAVMGTFYIAGTALGRQKSGAMALALSAGVLALADPDIVGLLSFQLSALAMVGLLYLAPLFEQALGGLAREEEGWRRHLLMTIAATLGATLAVWPLIAVTFHYFSLTGALVTLLALPFLSLLIVTALAAAVAGALQPLVGSIVGLIAWPWPSLLARLIQAFDLFPLAAVPLELRWPGWLWVYYSTLLLTTALLHWKRPLATHPAGKRGILPVQPGFFAICAVALAAGNAVVWGLTLGPPSGNLDVVFLDVGQGDSILITTPSGTRVLVDGGPDRVTLARLLGQEMPFWDRRIDLVVSTHGHQDHLDGLIGVMERQPVGQVVQSPLAIDTPAYAEWRALLARANVPVTTAQEGAAIDLGDGIRLEVLHPPDRPLLGTPSDPNENSVVLRLVYGDVSFLLTGDIQEVSESYLVRRNVDMAATVLKVGHQGSATSSTPAFLDAVHPHVAVVTVGVDNTYGHPSPIVLDRLRSYVGDRLFITRDSGTVRFSTDGNRLWVTTER